MASEIIKTVRNLHVTTKLMAAFGIMAVLTVLISFEGIRAADMLDADSNAVFKEDLSGISAIKEAAIFQVKYLRILRDIVLASGDKDAIQNEEDILTELQNSADEWVGTAQKAFTDNASQIKLSGIKSQVPALHNLSTKVIERALANDQSGALVALKQTNVLGNQINLLIAEICRLHEEKALKSRTEGQSAYQRGRRSILCCAVISILFAAALCLVTLRMIARPLTLVMKTLQQASSGDLTKRLHVENQDEIGAMSQALNEALESTRSVLQQVREMTADVDKVSSELAATANGMARSARSQADGLSLTSASLEKITISAKNNAEHARQANELATHSQESARRGHLITMAAVKAMAEISESSGKISEIATTVDDVAFQTNLLSVNAAIEAARAGEEGQGFAVVAEEVRNLSRRSTDSAADIRSLIKHSLRTVKKGSESIHESGITLQDVASSVNEVQSFVAEIMSASAEQSVGVGQLHASVIQMGKLTRESAEQASTLTDAATRLSSRATGLRDMLNRFTLDTNLARKKTN